MESKEQLIKHIDQLKKERNAIILAHNYEPDEIQAIADFTGDSLELSRKAANIDADVVLFCGVHFMAETAYILSPDKTILMPVPDAGCEMADMIDAEQVRKLKSEHPQASVICYVNSSAEVKAECDCCCTSANAVAVARAFADAPEILFVPDRNLGGHVAGITGQKFIDSGGYCPVHNRITAEEIAEARAAHPGALVLAHPECPPEVRASVDHLLSTGQMCRFASASEHQEFIIVTEIGILYRLHQENPGKKFYSLPSRPTCPDMKKPTLESVVEALEELKYKVTVPADIADRARGAIEKMMTVS